MQTSVSHAEAFVDAEAWGAGTGFAKATSLAKRATATLSPSSPSRWKSLTYVRRDAANGVRVAAFTERSRATPLLEEQIRPTQNAVRLGAERAALTARHARARAMSAGLGVWANGTGSEPRAPWRRDEDGGLRVKTHLRDALARACAR